MQQVKIAHENEENSNLGNSIEDYDVGQQIGKGGFAVVYRGRCRNTGREVAIKKISKSKINSGGLINRVREEVTIHSRVSHPAILELYTFFEDQNFVYLILELCLNGELQKYIERRGGVLKEDEAREYLSQIVSGMLYLHDRNIMHRDLKLANLLLDNQGRIKIADFGLATQLKRPDEKHMTLCGTPNYISPEVATRNSHSLPSDVWSIGIMLYTILVGRPPFDEKGASKDAIFTRIAIGDYTVPSHVSQNARLLISKCLEKNPQDRIKLDAIPNHRFMISVAKRDISRMTDSGVCTMSTVNGNNHTRIPLSVISESNVSERDYSSNGSRAHPVKPPGDLYGNHPVSPPVRMKSNPSDLLPPNAGVIDNLKKRFTPLPSFKWGENFAVPHSLPPRRERDISEERRKQRPVSYRREGSVSSNDSDRSNSSRCSSQMNEEPPRYERQGFYRGSSEQNIMQGKAFERNSTPSRRHRSLERGIPVREGQERYDIYGHPLQQKSNQVFYESSQARSLEEFRAPTHHGEDYEHERRTPDFGGRKNGTPRKAQNNENSTQRERRDCQNSGHARSRSRDRNHDSNHHSYGEKSLVKNKGSSRDHFREESHKQYTDCSANRYVENSLERRRDRLHEPEHRSYREEPVDDCRVRHHSCCQSSKHLSWCDKKETKTSQRKNNNENRNSNSRPFQSGSSNRAPSSMRGQSPQRSEVSNQVLGDVPRVNHNPSDNRSNGENTQASRSHRTPTKKVSGKSDQIARPQVSPLCSKRLKPTTSRVSKNANCHILANGDICVEFIEKRKGIEMVVDVCRITSDGMQIVIYRPNGGSGSRLSDNPPPYSTEDAASIYSYENLPKKYFTKYIYASRFVKIVKSQTPKVSYYSDQAKCVLMENSPDPEFEAMFYCGVKITSMFDVIKVIESNGRKLTVPKASAPRGLPEEFHSFYLHYQEVRKHCLYLEGVLTEVSSKTSLDCFPVTVGRKPPGVSTPPVSARGQSHPSDNKENMPVALSSYRSPKNATDRLGSFQDSLASMQITGNHNQATKSNPCHSSATRVPSPTMKGSLSPVFIPNIGWASKEESEDGNVVIAIQWLDRTDTRLMVSNNGQNVKIMFTEEGRESRWYSTNEDLPSHLKEKLSNMDRVLKFLEDASSSSKHVGLR